MLKQRYSLLVDSTIARGKSLTNETIIIIIYGF